MIIQNWENQNDLNFKTFGNWILEFEIYLGIGACNLGFNLLDIGN